MCGGGVSPCRRDLTMDQNGGPVTVHNQLANNNGNHYLAMLVNDYMNYIA